MANANASKVKMKNHSMILLFLLLLTIFSSCSKTEKTLSDIPADQDSELLTNCKTDRKLAKMMAMPTKALNQSINQFLHLKHNRCLEEKLSFVVQAIKFHLAEAS